MALRRTLSHANEAVSSWPPVLLGLAVAGMADWVITRTLTRVGIFMPKSPFISASFQALGTVGQFATNVTSLLALTAIAWISWRLARQGQRALPIALGALVVLSLGGLFFAPAPELTLSYHFIVIAVLLLILRPVAERSKGRSQTVAVVLPAAALLVAELYQVSGALPSSLGRENSIGLSIFVLGEMLVVASGLALGWWMRPKANERWIWAAAAVPAVAFSSLYLGAPSMSGVLAIWSIGLTLYLPWPIYALSLWACAAALLTGVKRRHPAAPAIALLLAGGYAPQLSTQLLLSLTALYLLVSVTGLTDGQASRRADTGSAPKIGLGSEWEIEPL